MSAALASQILVGIFDAPERRIDQVVALVYRGYAEGHIDDAEADQLYGAAQLRRGVFAARRMAKSARVKLAAPRCPADRRESRDKRRTWSTSGALPPRLRARFTAGENAVAAVIRAEVRRHGTCSLSHAAIAKCAGLLSVTVVKRFIREARRAGLIDVKHRPVRGDRHKPNVITIISREWMAWNEGGARKGGGGTGVPPYQNTGENSSQKAGNGAERQTASTRGEAEKGLWRGSAGPYRTQFDRWRNGDGRK